MSELGNANVWFFRHTKNGPEILFQKRSKFVDGNPGKYDVSAGGHIDPGETPLEGALRETYEEIGIKLFSADLIPVCEFFSKKPFYVFCVDRTGEDDAFRLDPKEVELVKWVPLSDIDMFVERYTKAPLQKNRFQLDKLKEVINGDNQE